jgi:hypothetical protein
MSEDICIICQDSGNELLIKNTFCSCNYKRHNSCWLEYIKSKPINTCVQCRKVLNNIPQYLVPHPIEPPSQYYQVNSNEISYQQLQEIIRNSSIVQHDNSNIQNNSTIQGPITEDAQRFNKKIKIIKLFTLALILLVISIILIRFID